MDTENSKVVEVAEHLAKYGLRLLQDPTNGLWLVSVPVSDSVLQVLEKCETLDDVVAFADKYADEELRYKFEAMLDRLSLTQRGFAKALGLSEDGISHWKRTGKYPGWVWHIEDGLKKSL
ncbi:hypothetical protein KCM76_22775 [Zooshikella marina]|uniref:hypothetical protein n=1 Tax=Zooshikella ganghwensis TaxID=202772 RepID=UPI001BAFBA41|nr:hypothetical protein [Zooshikella ganghwensis]MBU2708836.1 hypothetical protein [Zooshikella ganghwensis]